MSDKSSVIIQTVNTQSNALVESPVIPNGKIWVIKKFGAGVEALNDGYSGNVVLRFGSEILRPLVLYGNSKEIELRIDITGDGSKKLNVYMENPSNVDKKFVFWYQAYERS